MSRLRLFAALPLLAIALMAGCGGSDDRPTSALPMNCAEVTTQALNITGLTVASAISVPASGAIHASPCVCMNWRCDFTRMFQTEQAASR